MSYDYLYAPDRAPYHAGAPTKECVFCSAHEGDKDEETQIIHRDSDCFVIMNKYPYTPAHFMVIPYAHECNLENLELSTWLKMNELAKLGAKILKENFGAHGVNIGINLGAAAGAGIAEHLHLHVLPRFNRDTNFITTIGNTRVYSADSNEIYQKLKFAFSNALTNQ